MKISWGEGTIGNQTTKSIFDIRTRIVASIEVTMVLHLRASSIPLYREYVVNSRYHNVRKIGDIVSVERKAYQRKAFSAKKK